MCLTHLTEINPRDTNGNGSSSPGFTGASVRVAMEKQTGVRGGERTGTPRAPKHRWLTFRWSSERSSGDCLGVRHSVTVYFRGPGDRLTTHCAHVFMVEAIEGRQ